MALSSFFSMFGIGNQAPLIEDGFIDRGLIDFNYPKKDYHEMYIGEIIKVLIKE